MKNNILYLDDEKNNLEVFRVCFMDDYHVYIAANKVEAENILNNQEIKVLITDQNMPDQTGLEFIMEVKQKFPDLICNILTAYPDNDLLMSAINEVEVFHFLVKPWKEYELKQTIDRAIEAYDAKKERDQLIYDLKNAKERAEESDRLKSIFLGNLSHEIRTPLNGIMGFSSMLAEKPENDPEALKKYTKIINTSCDKLLQIIEDLILASKIQVGNETIKESVFSLKDLFVSLHSDFYALANNKKIRLQLNPFSSNGITLIKSDLEKLREVFSQLLRNAIQYTETGFIEFGISEANKTFYVKDTGIGIEHTKQKLIFEFFRQESEKMNTRAYGGNGLGLSIAKGYVNLAGGDIWMESEQGKGTTVFFTFKYVEAGTNAATLKEKINI